VASERQLYADNLKVILMGAVIAGQCRSRYSEFDWWSYADVCGVTLLRVVGASCSFRISPMRLPMVVEYTGLDCRGLRITWLLEREPTFQIFDSGDTSAAWPRAGSLKACSMVRSRL
jgi:hypothetical protein